MTPDPPELRRRILSVIEREPRRPLPDDEFDELARALFAHQYARNRPYRAYCDARQQTPESVDSWLEIPAVPTDAFKAAALVCGDPADARAVFRTSGTTAGRERRGTHAFLDLTLYDAALRRTFEEHVLADRARLPILSLVPHSSREPDSSLSHMLTEIVAEFGDDGSEWLVSEDGLDVSGAAACFEEAERSGRPVLVAGTSLAFLHLFEALAARGLRFQLPDGSRAMDTGGFKGVSREISRGDLLGRFEATLGIPESSVFNEYGMTEMSSQLYARGAGSHVGPAWLRTRAVSPETLRPLGDDEIGVLRHWDLANMDSVAVLQTADLGRTSPDGVDLLGRAKGAEARGCSIAMDELLSALER